MLQANTDTAATTGEYGGGYVDVSTIKTKSIQSSERSARNALNQFLSELHTTSPIQHPHKTLETLTQDELLHFASVFGRFPDFLLKTKKIMMGSALSYISQARKIVLELCTQSDINNDRWYKNLRKQTGKCFTKKHREENTKKSNAAPPMSSEDLSGLCNLLFTRNTTKSAQERALLVLQWQALGRVSETTALTYKALGWHKKYDCLSVVMNREKVDLEHTIHCFLHSHDWLICPLHALGKNTQCTRSYKYKFKHIIIKYT